MNRATPFFLALALLTAAGTAQADSDSGYTFYGRYVGDEQANEKPHRRHHQFGHGLNLQRPLTAAQAGLPSPHLSLNSQLGQLRTAYMDGRFTEDTYNQLQIAVLAPVSPGQVDPAAGLGTLQHLYDISLITGDVFAAKQAQFYTLQ